MPGTIFIWTGAVNTTWTGRNWTRTVGGILYAEATGPHPYYPGDTGSDVSDSIYITLTASNRVPLNWPAVMLHVALFDTTGVNATWWSAHDSFGSTFVVGGNINADRAVIAMPGSVTRHEYGGNATVVELNGASSPGFGAHSWPTTYLYDVADFLEASTTGDVYLYNNATFGENGDESCRDMYMFDYSRAYGGNVTRDLYMHGSSNFQGTVTTNPGKIYLWDSPMFDPLVMYGNTVKVYGQCSGGFNLLSARIELMRREASIGGDLFVATCPNVQPTRRAF